uniref:Cyclic nucleotide-binding domain-containing protein n=1 Tax=Macrostomum lignano TaxID=282301 RepID=A0A1I8GUH4_9PLAT
KNYQEDESVKVVDTLKGFTIENSDLTFDPSYFRAKREIDLTGEMKAILQLEPQARTTEQVQTVMYGLQTLPTFNEYPLRTQEKLARVAFYQSVPPGRLIIRQGHIGVNFYIIIRGRVIVSVMQEDRRTGDTRTNIVARLGQGQSFGEVALLRQVARTASVVSQDATQLLAIGREEFNEIFTKPEPGRLLPGHVEFLAGCGFMRSFPLERLTQQPSACLLTFFRRNALIAPDSKAHPHLVVVRSGSCRVVKNLELSADSLNGAAEDEEAAGAAERSGVSFGKDVGRSEPKVDTWRRRPQAFAASLTVGSKHHQGQVSPRYWQPQPVQLQVSRHEHHGAATVLEVSRPGHHPHQLQALMEAEELPERPKLRRRLAMNAGEESGAEKTVVAVQVSTLKPGDVFGLSDVIFKGESNPEIEASASVALVSNGAECVLLSKAFFVQHATEQVRRDVRELARPYPEEAVFEDNYRCQVAWDKYRRRLFRDTLRRIDAARGGDNLPSELSQHSTPGPTDRRRDGSSPSCGFSDSRRCRASSLISMPHTDDTSGRASSHARSDNLLVEANLTLSPDLVFPIV